MTQSKTPASPRLVKTREEIHPCVLEAKAQSKRIGLVPTMGALHAGHLSLVEASANQCDLTVVTIFVNPTQFNSSEDLQNYSRDLGTDLEALSPYEVSLVFAPSIDEMYPPGHTTVVEVGKVAEPLEGEFRPGHFRGVATVVLKLFNMIPADIAYFGQKDYQQSLVIRQMVKDLDVPIQIRVCPIVREPDGLAMSSRNVHLSAIDRQRALALFRSLQLAAELVESGQRNAKSILQQMRQLIDAAGAIQVDYIALADPNTLENVEEVNCTTLAAVAATVGKTRLIDNRLIG